MISEAGRILNAPRTRADAPVAATIKDAEFWQTVPRLSPAQVALFKELSLATGAWQIKQRSATLDLRYDPTITAATYSTEVEVWFGDEVMSLYLTDQVIEALMRGAGYTQAFDVLPTDIAAIVLEHLMRSHVDPLQDAFGGFMVGAVHRYDGKPPEWLMTFRLTQTALSDDQPKEIGAVGLLATEQVLTEFVAKFFTSSPSGNTSFDLPIPARVVTREFDLALGDLRRLRSGNGLMLPIDWSPKKDLRLKIGRSHIAATQDGPTGFELVGALQMIPPAQRALNRKDWTMALDPETSMSVSIELARKDLTVREITSLSTGSVLTINAEPNDTVRILVGDTPLGEGQLVRLQDGFGVRVTRRF